MVQEILDSLRKLADQLKEDEWMYTHEGGGQQQPPDAGK
jgi:hypothetical protein